jgi:lysophospholipase L1-like esterase
MRYLTVPVLTALLLAGCTNPPKPETVAPVPATGTSAAAPAPSRFDLPATDDGLPGMGPVRRYAWFKKLWRERRTTWAGRVEQDQRAIVFLGDSITQGWHDDFDGMFPELKTANRGISGDTTRGVLIRLQEDVLALHPRAVVLLIGTNDLEEQATPWTIASNLRLILDELKRHDAAMPVIVCEVMPSSATKKRPANLIRRLNQLIREATADQPQVTVIETWKLFAGPQNDAKAEEFPDLLHPGNTGYAKWAGALRPVLATLGFLDTDRDEFTIENDFVSLFNGHDLTGWGYRPTTPADIESAKRWQSGQIDAAAWPVVKEAVSFDGLTASPDGRFVARNGRLIVTTPMEGRRIQQLWTRQEFPQNFVLRLQFRATPNTDSGIYVRAPQLQCRDYLLAGPYTKLQHYRAGDWNDIEITVKDNVARATCNGEVLEEAMKLPETGPIGLEGDKGQMEYRRIRLMTLP